MTTKEKLYDSFSAVTEAYDGLTAISELFIGSMVADLLTPRDERIVEILENKGFIAINNGRIVNRPRIDVV